MANDAAIQLLDSMIAEVMDASIEYKEAMVKLADARARLDKAERKLIKHLSVSPEIRKEAAERLREHTRKIKLIRPIIESES